MIKDRADNKRFDTIQYDDGSKIITIKLIQLSSIIEDLIGSKIPNKLFIIET